MKLNATTLPVESSLQNPTSTFSIKTTAKAFKILSDGLYKNKILAFVRELSRNAYDAHIAAGRLNIPFEIHLPNDIEPWYHVKDFGTGLSHENVIHLYTTYFESTKQDSNDYVGALGLGSKSPFSYVTRFTVKSRFNSVESTYTCFLSKDGIPSIVKLGETASTELPGLTVILPIEKVDFNAVKIAVKQDFLYWEGTKPNVVGDTNFVFANNERVLTGKNWYKIKGNINSFPIAVQGNVGYPITRTLLTQKDNLKNSAETDAINFVFSFNPVIQFEIGKLDVTASREELSYDDLTIRNLIDSIVDVTDDFVKKFNDEMLEIIKEPIELVFRRKMFTLINKYRQISYSLTEYLKKQFTEIKWKNKKFNFFTLSNISQTFYVEGISNLEILKIISKDVNSARKLNSGKIILFYDYQPGTNKFEDLLNSSSGQPNVYNNGKYEIFDCWNVNKKVLSKKEHNSKIRFETTKQKFENLNKSVKVFTYWDLPLFSFNGEDNIEILLNDKNNLGKLIAARFAEMHRNVFLIDYKKSVPQNEVNNLVKTLTNQLSGLKITPVSQIKVNDDVDQKSKDTPAKNIKNVTYFDRSQKPYTRKHSLIEFNSIRVKRNLLEICCMFNKTEKELDFSTGDFYYFYGSWNKTFLDKECNIRVNSIDYLNILNYFKLIPNNAEIVSLKPVQINKILKEKKQGKLLPINILDKSLHDLINLNEKLIKTAMVLKSSITNPYVNRGIINSMFMDESCLTEILKKMNLTKYSNIKNEFKDVIDYFNAILNFDDQLSITALHLFSYDEKTNFGFNSVNGFNKIINKKEFLEKIDSLNNQIKNNFENFYNKYPITKHLTTNVESSTKKLEIFEEIVDYVNLKNV